MKKFETLLELIKTAIPSVLQKRIDTLNTEIAKLPALEEAQKNNPSDDNQEALDNQNKVVLEMEESVVSRLQVILDKQTEIEEKLKTPTPKPVEKPVEKPAEEKDKKSNTIAYVALAVLAGALTFGAVNMFKNRS